MTNLLDRITELEDAIEDALDSLVEAQREASHGLTANGRVIDQYVTAAAIDLRAVLDSDVGRATSGSATEHPVPGVRHQEFESTDGTDVEFSSGMRAAQQAQEETLEGKWDE